MRKSLRRTRKGLQSTGKAMMPLAAGTAAAGVAFLGVTRIGMRFEKSMSSVQAILRGTSAEFEALSEQAKMLGRTTVFTASQSSEAMMFLARAGFKSNEIIAAMPGLLNLAAAGQLELADATNIAAQVLRGMGIAASDSGRVADVLAEAAANANTDVLMLGNAFGYVAPVARSLGVSLEETAAAIGILSDAGIQGDRAGTGLRRMFGHLAEEIGKKGMIQTLQDLAAQNITAAEAMDRFGQRAGPAVLALTQNTPRLQELLSTLQASAGAAEEMARVRLDNLAGDITLLSSAAEGISVAVFESMDAQLRSFVQEVTTLFQSIVPHVEHLIEAFARTGSSSQGAGMTIIDAFGSVSYVLGMALDGVKALRDGFKVLQSFFTYAAGGILKAVGWIADGINYLHEIIGLPTVDTSFIQTLGDDLLDEGGKVWDQAMQQMLEPPPSESMEKFIDGVRESFRTMNNEVEKVPGLATDAIVGLQSMGDGTEMLSESVLKLTDRLEEQIATFGMTAHEADRWKLSQEGASDAAMKAVEALQRQAEALEKQADLMKEGQRVFENTRTPIEEHAAELEKLRELLDAGAIDQDTFRRAVEAADTSLKKDTGGGITGGSVGLGTALGSVKVPGVIDMAELQRKSNTIQLNQLETLYWMKNNMNSGSASFT